MQDDIIAKVLALKAYLLGKQAVPQDHNALRDKALQAVQSLGSSETADGLRRRVFYNLLLAELLRTTDPIPSRVAALEAGEQLTELGYVDPTPIYMKIVDATTERRTTAHFGDFQSSCNWSHSSKSNSPLAESQALQASLAPVLAAIELEKNLVEEHYEFLQSTSLDEIMKKHGIT